ncbi:MAG: TonB-dependent receptor, partial [Opitutales bacterium]
GYGLFLNLSLRGVDSQRSKKVTILEDGIPSSPSPFSAPDAYYSPTAGRMSGFEVLKGSSQLKHGPQNTGGVINYLSTPIPSERASHLRFSYGSYNERVAHAYSGDSTALGDGAFGYLLEVFDHRTDGWKTIGSTAAHSAKDAGFNKNDLMLKLSYAFGADNGSYLEFKAGRTDLDGDVSYLGLSQSDYAANAYQRYAATRFDNMDSDQTRYYLRFLRELSPEATLSTSVFYNQFNRDWYKIADLTPTGGNKLKVGYKNGAADATYGVTSSSDHLNVLKGDANGSFTVKHNDRSYTVKGVQANLEYEMANHKLDLGFRYTDDVYDKNPHKQDTYGVTGATGVIALTGSSDNSGSRQTTEALEVYFIDQIDLGEFTVIPGVRYTSADYVNGSTSTDFDDVLLGVGGIYPVSENLQVFGGVYQGHALPGPSAAASGLSEEQSLGFEIGVRGDSADDIGYELTYFHTSFDDLITYENLSGTANDANVGEATSQGLEATIALDLGDRLGVGVKMPTKLSLTYTDARFDVASERKDGNYWTNATTGNELPYVVDLQFNLRTGVKLERTSLFLTYNWTDESYVDAANSAKIDSNGLLDLSAFFELSDSTQLFGKITNLTDEEYVLGYLPDGYRVGAPRVASIGLKMEF